MDLPDFEREPRSIIVRDRRHARIAIPDKTDISVCHNEINKREHAWALVKL